MGVACKPGVALPNDPDPSSVLERLVAAPTRGMLVDLDYTMGRAQVASMATL